MKTIIAFLLIAIPALSHAQKNKTTSDTKAVISSNQNQALIIVDGIKFSRKDSINVLDSIKPETIERMDVVKGEQALLEYGEEGRGGVILVTTKTPAKKEKAPLYILDGVKIKSIEGVNPDDIESVHVLKGKESTSEYGSEGEAGVVLITTKSQKKQHKK
jgi:TonB-dependent SusC/RagA subfamily outer membrane receptor